MLGATEGAEGTFYYLVVETADPAAGAIRDVVLYMASMKDGSTMASIVLNESKGKLYEDDNTYGAIYKPLGSVKLRYS